MGTRSRKNGLAGGCAISSKLRIKGDSPSFLIVVLRYIGDVLVTTPLARSIKNAYPGARVEYLVFSGTGSCLAKNPYVDRVHTIARGERKGSTLLSLYKKFDFALAANPSDRSMIYAGLAGKKSIGLYYKKKFWMGLLLDQLIHCDDRRHVVPMMLVLLEPLGIEPIPEVVMGFDGEDVEFAAKRLPKEGYVILHPYSRSSCKYWPVESWGRLAAGIAECGLTPVFTITGDPEDGKLLDLIMASAPAVTKSLTEPFTLPQLAAAIKNSRAYVGIDTVVTHVAAASGARVIALFGPTLTRYWAPWPNGSHGDSPFAPGKGVQRLGNVTVMQQEWPCVPCNSETCTISSRGKMECLEELAPGTVLAEIFAPEGGCHEDC